MNHERGDAQANYTTQFLKTLSERDTKIKKGGKKNVLSNADRLLTRRSSELFEEVAVG